MAQLLRSLASSFRLTRLIWLVPILMTGQACTKVAVDFGQNYIGTDISKITRLDTISAVMTTVYVDSFATSGTGVAMIGNYIDPAIGQLNAATYLEFRPPINPNPTSFAKLDSLFLVLKPDSIYYGDTTQPLHLTAYRLFENITTNTTLLYSNQQFAHDPTPLGQTDVFVHPLRGDSIVIRLTDFFGDSLLTKLKLNATEIQTSDNFVNYFKGLTITATQNGRAVYGFRSDSMNIYLNYKEPSPTPVQSSVAFAAYNPQHQFNHINVDRTGTPLGNLGFGPNNRSIPATALGNRAFVDYLANAQTRITFPALQIIAQTPGFGGILSCQLILRPLQNTYNSPYFLPPRLRLATTDVTNLLGNSIVIPNSTTEQTGDLVVNYQFQQNTNYSYDLTSYINTQLYISPLQDHALLVSPQDNEKTIKPARAIFNSSNSNSGVQLIVNYISVK